MTPRLFYGACLILAAVTPIFPVLRWKWVGFALGSVAAWSWVAIGCLAVSVWDANRSNDNLWAMWLLLGWLPSLLYCGLLRALRTAIPNLASYCGSGRTGSHG